MYTEKGEKYISMLRWPSLVLVTVLLCLFLFKSFRSEKNRISQEVGIVFVNTIKNMESNLLNLFILDSLRSDIFFDTRKVHTDTTKQLRFITNENKTTYSTITRARSAANDSVKIILKKDFTLSPSVQNENSLTRTKGVISIMMRTHDTLSGNRSVFSYTWNADSTLQEKIKNAFDENLAKAFLNVKYELNQFHDSTTSNSTNQAATGFYKDLGSGQNYQVYVTNANWVALRAIWWEALLALLVLLTLALAFYSMNKTIKHEQTIMQARNDFIQNMTHELKTPIATIQVAMEALHEFDGLHDANKRDEYMHISQQELDRLSFMVDRVLSISKMDSTLPPPVKESIHLPNLVRQVLHTFKLQLDKNHANVQLHTNDDDILIFADKQWISGIVYNLIDNAIKYSQSENSEINIYINKNENNVSLNIQDNGLGIAQEHQSRIYEKFYRVPQGNVHTVKGHGLGLAFVKRLVHEMGGTIQLKSDLGKGSSFQIIWPA